MQRPITNEEVDQTIEAAAGKLFDSMFSLDSGPNGQSRIQTLQGTPFFRQAQAACYREASPRNSMMYVNTNRCTFTKVRAEFTSQLKAAITAPYSNVTDERTVGRFSKAWDGLIVGQHLVVVMPKDDADRLFKAGGKITYSIHEKNKPSSYHPRSRLRPIVREDFHWNEPVTAPQRNSEFVYSLKYVMEGEALDSSIYDAIAQQRRKLAEMAAPVATAPITAAEATPWWKFW